MKLYINANLQEFPDSVSTVAQLLEYLHIPAEGTGVGINNRVILASDRKSTPLQEGDRVTIISATYGG